MSQILSPEESEEYRRVYEKHVRLTNYAMDVLRRYGMESKEFADADAATCKTWIRLRELQGIAGKH
jgi:hypothetical protein